MCRRYTGLLRVVWPARGKQLRPDGGAKCALGPGGRVSPVAAPAPDRSIGLDWHGCCHGAVRGVFCNATNQELSKSSCPNVLPARHQYGLQIAEGVVTFFESYEQSG
jgi:hypothetical protein